MRGRLGALALILCLGIARRAAATSEQTATAVSSSTPAASNTSGERRPFVPVAGLLIYPFATDEGLGAGVQAGVRHDFLLLMFRENFLRSVQREEQGALLRLKQRTSFELALEAQVEVLKFVFYGGPGVLIRRDTWEWTRVSGERFVSREESELLVRPTVSFGFIGSVVEANALLVVRDSPELRLGLGFVVGRRD